MSDNTDVLGKAVSVSLKDLRGEEVNAAILALHETIGTSLIASIIQTGLLTHRTQITLDKWDEAIKSMKKAIASVPSPKLPKPPLPSNPPPPPSPTKKQSQQIPTPMDVDDPLDVDEPLDAPPKEEPKKPFEPFQETYIPSDLISEIYKYLDSISHGSFETCNKRLLIIWRKN